MPDKWPLANGNWSNAANWNGGTKPVAGDDVYADGRTVTVDESFTVATLRNTQRSGGTIGGSFVFNTAGVTGSCTSLSFGANNLIIVNLSSGVVNISVTTIILAANGITQHIVHGGAGDLIYNGGLQNGGAGTANIVIFLKSGTGLTTINGSVVSNGGNVNAVTFSQTGTGSTIVNGNISVPSFAGATGAHAVSISNGTLSINGGVSGTSSVVTTTYAINQTGGTVVINGNVTAPTVNAAVWTINQTGGILNVNGNITGGGSNSTAYGVNSLVGTSVTVNGNVTGGSGATPGAAINTSLPTTTIIGNVNAANGPAIQSSTANIINVTGTVTASASAPAIAMTNANGQVYLNGNMVNNNGKMAIFAPIVWLDKNNTTSAAFFTSGGVARTLYSADTVPNTPAANNVRSGTIYGAGNSLTGTLVMPVAANVRNGVTYDNGTTGTALFTTSQLLTEINASSDAVAVRMKNAATPQILGELMEAFKK